MKLIGNPTKGETILHTGIYSRLGYKVLDAAVFLDVDNCENCRAPFSAMDSRKNVFSAIQKYGYFDCLTYDSFAFLNSDPSQKIKRIFIADDGELFVRVYTNYNDYSLTPKKFINLLNLHESNIIAKFQKDHPDIAEGYSLMKCAILGKINLKDCNEALYRKYIGEPMNPFESEIYKDNLEKFKKILHKCDYGKVTVPKEFEEEWEKSDSKLKLHQYHGTMLTAWIDRLVMDNFEKLVLGCLK